MDEYINKKKLRDALYDADAVTFAGLKIIDQMPPADVAPVVHARWERYDVDHGCPRCSNCKMDAPWDDFRGEPFITKRCPNCGALMDDHTTPAYRMAARLKARRNHDR